MQRYRIIHGFSLTKNCSPFHNIEVEVMVVKMALELALKTGFDWVILDGDSQILIMALWNKSHSLSHYGHIVKDI